MGISANAHSFNYFVTAYKEAIHSKIVSYLPSFENEDFAKVVREYIDRMGQYRRPGLVMLSGRLFGAGEKELLLPAAAQQASEDWILMQDDAFDGSEYRRGKPAAHKLYGWQNAINASDIGHMAMWRILKDYALQVGPEKGNLIFEKFYDMLSYTAEGQHIENNFIHFTKSLRNASEALYFRIADSKTCYYTVYGPMQIGAIAAGQQIGVLNALREIGQNAGIAFQIVDDVLDMNADESKFGKKKFGDLYEGKLTLMMLHSYRSATPDEKEKIDAIYSKERQDKTSEEIDFLKEMIEKYRGIEYAQRTAKAYGERAKTALSRYKSLIPQNEFTPIIMSAIEELYVRNK
ncbi:MAG: polyprenyl synthetase family protein [Candidatus Micrarchaeota archaeon]|nr:polyprenyl synthetase family protein [Candidatus Micrarchaeota archaeon]